MKKQIFLLISLILFTTIHTNGMLIKNELIEIKQLNNSENIPGLDDSTPLVITKITDGYGLNIEIINQGTFNLSDILIELSFTGGYSISLSRTIFNIPYLKCGQKYTMHVQTSGIGIGVWSNEPRIYIIGTAPHVHPMQKGIIVHIIGPFINYIGDFIDDPRSFEGFTLFTPEWYTDTYLINNDGEVVHRWTGSNLLNGLGSLLLENGHMIRSALPWPNPKFLAGGILGRVEEFDWNGSRIWYFDYTNQEYCHHHGVEILPNGNIMMIAWEYKSREEAIQAGRNPELLHSNELYPDHIIEVEPIYPNGGRIVWEWHVWDHLIQDYDPSKDNFGDIASHPELININFGLPDADWNHINSIDYNAEFDQIMLSVKHFSEIWIIDHSTTTEEAGRHIGGRYGKGGDLLYRWGNPEVYHAGEKEDQTLFSQHDAQWIEQGLPGEGNILIFNNGNGRPGGEYSSIEEIIPPVDEYGFYHKIPFEAYEPYNSLWTYTKENPYDFFSYHISGCQRLPNGNTLICDGANGFFFEVTLDKEVVWEYMNSFPSQFNNKVFKIHRYPLDYPGLRFLDR